MTDVWKPRQERSPASTTSTQTKTKMPYSNSPIRRASTICDMKAIAALSDPDDEGGKCLALGAGRVVVIGEDRLELARQRGEPGPEASRKQSFRCFNNRHNGHAILVKPTGY